MALGFGGGGFSGGFGPYTGSSKGQAKSTPELMLPDMGKVKSGFDLFQGGMQNNELQRMAVDEQRGLRGRLDTLLNQNGAGQRARITDRFDTASRNATGALVKRGFAGSSLNLPAQTGVERERSMALGDLNDRLLQQRMGMESGVSKNISDLLFGSSEQGTNMLASILGSGRIGNTSESNSTGSTPNNNTGLGKGPSKDSGKQGRDEFNKWKSQFSQPSGSPGGSPSGSPGGNPGGGPMQVQNPFFREPGGSPDYKMSFPDGDPLNPNKDDEGQKEIVLEPDRGPVQTPEAYKRNQERLNNKRPDQTVTWGNGGSNLAGGPGDSLGGGLNSGTQPGQGMA